MFLNLLICNFMLMQLCAYILACRYRFKFPPVGDLSVILLCSFTLILTIPLTSFFT